MSTKMASETIYGNHEETHVMSEKVQSLAATVYKEFEKVIKRYDEDVVKDLMPLVVGILESLDASFTEKSELDVEIELLREDNEQLLTQYEREKQLRKSSEQKYLEMEDQNEGAKKDLQDKIEALESLVRMSEIKSRNTSDHVSRLEEKENESKNEYNKLHERYTELIRTHMDYMERTKILMGTDKLSELSDLAPKINKGQFALPGLRPVSMAYGMEIYKGMEGSPMGFELNSPRGGNVSLKNELDAMSPPAKAVTPASEAKVAEDLTKSTEVAEKATTKDNSLTNPAQQPPSLPNSSSETTKTDNSRLSDSDSQLSGSVISSMISSGGTTDANRLSENDSVDSGLVSEKESSPRKEQETPSGEKAAVVMRRKKKVSEDDSFEHSQSYEEDVMPGMSRTLDYIVATTPELEESHDSAASTASSEGKRKSVRNDNSIFEELSVQGTDMIAEVDFGADITGREVNPGDYASTDSEDEDDDREDDDRDNDKDSVGDNFFGMGKELENLILENTELLATKNALNIVKDDLIAKVDELSSEAEILREDISSLQSMKTKLQARITQLEEEVKSLKEGGRKGEGEPQDQEDDVPMAQRKRFTRVEMARVLMERNQYKERLMELQEAVRWTEMIRASREHPAENPAQNKKKSTVWNFFSELVAPSSSSLSSPSPRHQIPARHQNTINAVLHPSAHHTSPHTPSDLDPIASLEPSHSLANSWPDVSSSPNRLPGSSVTLVPSPTNSAISHLPHVTLLPPPEAPTFTINEASPVPVPVFMRSDSASGSNNNNSVSEFSKPLPPTPSEIDAMESMNNSRLKLDRDLSFHLPPTPSGAPPPSLITCLPIHHSGPTSNVNLSLSSSSQNRNKNNSSSPGRGVSKPGSYSPRGGSNPVRNKDIPKRSSEPIKAQPIKGQPIKGQTPLKQKPVLPGINPQSFQEGPVKDL